MKKIILASGSPRRKEILSSMIGDNYEVITSDFEENNEEAIAPAELVKKHALWKARNVAKDLDEGVVIGSDTIVVLNDEVLWKPKDKDDAVRMLQTQSWNVVKVLSGLAVVDAQTGEERVDFDVTNVYIKEISKQEIADYIATWDPLDKAWGFGIQTRWTVFIEKIEGCFFNVVGLPVFKLNNIFIELWINIFDYKS